MIAQVGNEDGKDRSAEAAVDLGSVAIDDPEPESEEVVAGERFEQTSATAYRDVEVRLLP